MTTKRLLFALLSAAFVAAALMFASLPASAVLRTFEVRMLNGSVIRVTVDAPASLPASQVPLPGQLIQEITPQVPTTPSIPSLPLPTFFDALPGPSQAVPNFVIQQFQVPLFLLPIYQAAGIQYGVRWEVLAAINQIETDYGRNLNVSSAGAVGWMQFLPSTWKTWGVDANGDGVADPYNPVDAIFAAGRYLHAAGASKNLKQSIYAYNHADWYVQSVLL